MPWHAAPQSVSTSRGDHASATLLAFAGRFFSPSAREQLAVFDREQRERRFVELWTLKEAYIKALGLGLRVPLHSFGFSIDASSGISLSGGAAGHWQFWLRAVGVSGRIAVAVQRTCAEPARVVSFHNATGVPGNRRSM